MFDRSVLKLELVSRAALRVVLGGMFACHGVQKIFGLLHAHEQPAPWSQLWWGGLIELVCGGLVALGFGVTILSDMVFRPWSLEGKRIEARPILDAVPQMDAGMIWRKGAALSGPATALQQFLIHACST